MTHLRRVFILVLAAPLLMACILPVLIQQAVTSSTGALAVDIHYTGDWYIDTFNYSREAENIRHLVLVMSESDAARAEAGRIFNSIVPQSDGSLTMREDRQEYAWALDYLYEAPEGYFEGEFEPGTYAIAVAFIAGPLSREEAGVSEDVILFAGVTGGGASTDYQTVSIAAGETTSLTIELTDRNGWACPWLYVFNGHTFERRTEILRNIRGAGQETTEIVPIGRVIAIDGWIVVQVAEEKDEVTYMDAFYLLIDSVAIPAEAAPVLAAADGDYLTIRRDEVYEFRFRAPSSFAEDMLVSVMVTGYYVPLD